MKNKMPIERKLFVGTILAIKKVNEYIDELNALERKYNVETRHFPRTLENELIDVLEAMTNDKDDWITYFIYELNYGDDWCPGMITDVDGSDIVLQTPNDLYDLLESIYTEKGEIK